MDKELNKKYHASGVFEFESLIEIRRAAGVLMTQTAELSSKIALLNIDEDFDEKIGASLIDAIKNLSELNRYLIPKISRYREQFSERQTLESTSADDSIPPQVENAAVSFEVKG